VKILFVGSLGLTGSIKGGGHFKSMLLLETYKRLENSKFKTIDTSRYKVDFRIILEVLYHIFFKKYDVVIFSTATKSADRLFTLISVFKSKILKNIVYHPQGMFIEQAIQTGIYNGDKYKSLRMLYLESERATQLFKELEINALYFPNYKRFNLDKLYLKPKESDSTFWKFIYISRISKDKGVFVILDAMRKLELQQPTIQLDFYGPIDEEIKFEFESRVKHLNNVNYCGFLDIMNDTDGSYEVMSTYDLMIFPTFWKGEGIAGVFIDSFISGLPVLTTSWNVNEEVIVDNHNGWIIPVNDVDALVEKLKVVLTDINKLNEMKTNAFTSRGVHHFENVSENLIRDVLNGNN
jgi:glycosyltransferase involved in cell wall biosynthesis